MTTRFLGAIFWGNWLRCEGMGLSLTYSNHVLRLWLALFPNIIMFPCVLSEKAHWFSPGLLAKRKLKVAPQPQALQLPAISLPQELPADLMS